jgi:phage repressor protein C with HTH and peptisase S24 domain
MNHIVSQRFVECLELLKASGKVRSARQFAMELGYLPQSLNEIIKGRRDVTIELIRKGSDCFNINPTYLFSGQGRKFSVEAEENNLKVLTVTVDRHGNENIVHVPVKAQAGYVARAESIDSFKDLNTYTIPGMEHRFGTYRSFEITGESMYPTFLPGETVICRYVEPSFWHKQLQNDHVYVIVSESDVVIKRLKNRLDLNQCIHLHSDNPEMEPYLMHADEIREIWYVEKVIRSFDQKGKVLSEEKEKYSGNIMELINSQSFQINALREEIRSIK